MDFEVSYQFMEINRDADIRRIMLAQRVINGYLSIRAPLRPLMSYPHHFSALLNERACKGRGRSVLGSQLPVLIQTAIAYHGPRPRRVTPSFITVICPQVQCNTIDNPLLLCCDDIANLDRIIKIERWATSHIVFIFIQTRRLRAGLCRDLWEIERWIYIVISSFNRDYLLIILL